MSDTKEPADSTAGTDAQKDHPKSDSSVTSVSEDKVADAETTNDASSASEKSTGSAQNGESETALEEAPDVLTNSAIHKTGEDDEDVLLNMRAKLYRFDVEGKEWKERGTGFARLLKHRETKKIRFLMRRDKTYKICGNHYVLPFMNLQPNANNDKSWIWNCPVDFSEDYNKPSKDIYAIRFQTLENAREFKNVWENSQKEMKELEEKR